MKKQLQQATTRCVSRALARAHNRMMRIAPRPRSIADLELQVKTMQLEHSEREERLNKQAQQLQYQLQQIQQQQQQQMASDTAQPRSDSPVERSEFPRLARSATTVRPAARGEHENALASLCCARRIPFRSRARARDAQGRESALCPHRRPGPRRRRRTSASRVLPALRPP